MLSACCGRVMKFLKKKGIASHSGARVMVAGTACSRFQMNSSKSKVWSSGSGDVVYLERAKRRFDWLLSDSVRDLDVVTWKELSPEELSKLGEGELLGLAADRKSSWI